jgi:hypothetical protein
MRVSSGVLGSSLQFAYPFLIFSLALGLAIRTRLPGRESLTDTAIGSSTVSIYNKEIRLP